MGNTDNRFGLKPVRYNEDFVEKFFVDADYATALFVGDCHAEAAEVEPLSAKRIAQERVEFLSSALDQQRQVQSVHVLLAETGVMNRRAQ